MSEDSKDTAYNFWRGQATKESMRRAGMEVEVLKKQPAGWLFTPLDSVLPVPNGGTMKVGSRPCTRPFMVDSLIISDAIALRFSVVSLVVKGSGEEILPVAPSDHGVPGTLFCANQMPEILRPVRVHVGEVVEIEVACHDVCSFRFWATLRGRTP